MISLTVSLLCVVYIYIYIYLYLYIRHDLYAVPSFKRAASIRLLQEPPHWLGKGTLPMPFVTLA